MDNAYLPRPLRVLSVMPQTAIDWTFRLESDLSPNYGQFLELSLPGLGEAPISISDFGSGWLDLTIRKVGRVTGGILRCALATRFMRAALTGTASTRVSTAARTCWLWPAAPDWLRSKA